MTRLLRGLLTVVPALAGGLLGALLAVANRWGAAVRPCLDIFPGGTSPSCAAPPAAVWAIALAGLCGAIACGVLGQLLLRRG